MYAEDKWKTGTRFSSRWDPRPLLKDGYDVLEYTSNNLTKGVRGALSELTVCSDLLLRGFEVFRAVFPTASCDLLVMRKNKIYRVEVKTVKAFKDSIAMPTYLNESKFDIVAFVVKDINVIIYNPKLEEIKNNEEEPENPVQRLGTSRY